MPNIHLLQQSHPEAAGKTAVSNARSTPQPTLESALEEFNQWRDNKKHSGSPIPDGLWHKVFDLAEIYTALQVRTIFGINTQQYAKKYKALRGEKEIRAEESPKSEGSRLCEVTIKPATSTKKKSSYQPQSLPSAKTLVVEFCRADGRIMKIHTTQDSIPTLMQAFYSEMI